MKMMQSILLLLTIGYGAIGNTSPIANSNNSDFYYEIGGARSIALPPNADVKTVKLGGAYEYGLGYSCGKFDPTLGLSNILNNLQNTGNNLINGAVGAVTSAIGSLPALILQRVDPSLYDLFQNSLIRAEATLSLANQTCEDYEQQIKNGRNPFSEWSDLSKVIDWKVQMGNGGFGSSKVDVVTAKKNVESTNGGNGIPWVGGQKAGGLNNPEIKATYDIVQAGYNITLNRNPAETQAPKATKNPPRLVEIWKKPAEASDWAVDVIGDVMIKTYDNHATQSVPGHGLLPKIETQMTTYQEKLTDLVAGKSEMTLTNLSAVSSNNILITRDVIEAIQTLTPSERTIAVSKLASEAAMSNVLEKALYIRRLLLTGGREPNVVASPAKPHIDESVAQLDREINDVLFEKRVTNELTTNTASLIMKLREQHNQRGQTEHKESGFDDNIIEQGAMQ